MDLEGIVEVGEGLEGVREGRWWTLERVEEEDGEEGGEGSLGKQRCGRHQTGC